MPRGVPAGRPVFGGGDFDRHVTRWNDNCVFCHNVAPNPARDPGSGRFDTSVAELGVACEACHGPGAEHVARNGNPLRRWTLQVERRRRPDHREPVAPDAGARRRSLRSLPRPADRRSDRTAARARRSVRSRRRSGDRERAALARHAAARRSGRPSRRASGTTARRASPRTNTRAFCNRPAPCAGR